MARWGHTNDHYLFRTYDFYAVQQQLRERMNQAISQATPDAICTGTVEEVAEMFAAQFRVQTPELTEGAISASVEETKVDVSRDPAHAFTYGAFGSEPHDVPGISATFYVPYRGDSEMLQWRPSTFLSVLPAAEIRDNELHFRFIQPGQDVAKAKAAFDEELSRVKKYLGWLRRDAQAFNQSLTPAAREAVEQRRGRLEELDHGTGSLGIPIKRTASVSPATTTRTTRSAGVSVARPATARSSPQYDVALSFAGEDRTYVQEVATWLKAAGVNVFYDDFEKAKLWGTNLIDHLADIYRNKSHYVVMFISEHYVDKAWTKHERQHAQARSLIANDEYILPVRFDDTDVPGMASTIGYIDLRKMTLSEFVDLVLVKLGKRKENEP